MLEIVKQNEWYHVGTMDINKKRVSSYEGDCLSVSQHPESWRRVAYLEGDTFRLYKEDGQFLNGYALTDEQMNEILTWGVKVGYLNYIPKKRFFLLFEKDEGEEFFSRFDFRKEWEEAIGWDAMNAEDQALLELAFMYDDSRFVATDALKKSEGWNMEDCPSDVVDMLILMRYADEILDIDGVYWEDALNEKDCSVPWASINTRRLGEWSIEKMSG